MDRLSDEVLLLIFCQLDDPAAFAAVSKRHLALASDPYTRASYFLTRHGRQHALYYALARGRLLNERAVDILVSSGAHVSRYLVQAVVQHVCRKPLNFIKGPWAKSLPFPVFAHFLARTASLYPDIDISKGEDDGTLFIRWVQQQRGTHNGKPAVSHDTIVDMFQHGRFMAFSPKDPVYLQLPLALALEPRLLPLAVANGFGMDSKYRDFIFRKIFEKPYSDRQARAQEIADKVRELTQLDSNMFLTRTVAAEVCMEACTNPEAYRALKKLNQSEDLRFDLGDLVVALLTLFLKTRSVTQSSTIQTLHALYKDFPTPKHPAVRLVMLLTIFCHPGGADTVTALPALQAKLGSFDLLPLTRADVARVLCNPFLEKPMALLRFARAVVAGFQKEEPEVIKEAVQTSLTTSCKVSVLSPFNRIEKRLFNPPPQGRLLRRLYESYADVRAIVAPAVVDMKIRPDDVPSWYDDDGGARAKAFTAPLCSGFGANRLEVDMYGLFPSPAQFQGEAESAAEDGEAAPTCAAADHRGSSSGRAVKMEADCEVEVVSTVASGSPSAHPPDGTPFSTSASDAAVADDDLGDITQDTLSARIQADEVSAGAPRNRRRWLASSFTIDTSGNRLPYPNDALAVGLWVRDQFGPLHEATAVCLTHALVNGNSWLVGKYVWDPRTPVPITLEHFRIMARLGRAPCADLWYRLLEKGPPTFYFSADDYLHPGSSKKPAEVAFETVSIPAKRRRLVRGEGRVAPSYAELDSDDEMAASSSAVTPAVDNVELHKWVHHLTLLHREEDAKWKEQRRAVEHDDSGRPKQRVEKNEFLKTLGWRLRMLRDLAGTRTLTASPSSAPCLSAAADLDDEEFFPGGTSTRTRHKRPRLA
ncbi:hypothetical protein AURDEDRAFT_182144, partial [Auricularia subglabra TFB-10046 SS5]